MSLLLCHWSTVHICWINYYNPSSTNPCVFVYICSFVVSMPIYAWCHEKDQTRNTKYDPFIVLVCYLFLFLHLIHAMIWWSHLNSFKQPLLSFNRNNLPGWVQLLTQKLSLPITKNSSTGWWQLTNCRVSFILSYGFSHISQ